MEEGKEEEGGGQLEREEKIGLFFSMGFPVGWALSFGLWWWF